MAVKSAVICQKDNVFGVIIFKVFSKLAFLCKFKVVFEDFISAPFGKIFCSHFFTFFAVLDIK